MAHPELAAHDPIFWIAAIILVSAVPLGVLLFRQKLYVLLAIFLIVFALPSGCYGLIGYACYVGDSCP